MTDRNLEVVLTIPQRMAASLACRASLAIHSGDLRSLVGLLGSGIVPRSPRTTSDLPETAVRLVRAIETLERASQDVTGRAFADVVGEAHARKRAKLEALLGILAPEPREESGSTLSFRIPEDLGPELVEALDLLSRLGIGQVESEIYPILSAVRGIGLDYETLREMSEELGRALGFAPGYSLGIMNQDVSVEARRSWEIKKAVELAIAMDRDPRPSFRGTNYDGLLLRTTNDPAPTCSLEEPAPLPQF